MQKNIYFGKSTAGNFRPFKREIKRTELEFRIHHLKNFLQKPIVGDPSAYFSKMKKIMLTGSVSK